MTVQLPQPVPPCIEAIIASVTVSQAEVIAERLTVKDEQGRWVHNAERLAASLSLSGLPISATTIKKYRRTFTFVQEMAA